MIEENNYNGFYCLKCKYIPLIQIIPKKQGIFILIFYIKNNIIYINIFILSKFKFMQL